MLLRMGVRFVGMYVGESAGANENLNKWCHVGIARDNLDDLIAAVLRIGGFMR